MCISSVCFFVCLNNIFLDKCISRTVQEGTLGTLHYRHNLDIIHQQSITIWWRLEGRGWSLDNGAYFSIDFCPFILKQTRTKKRLLHHEKNTHPILKISHSNTLIKNWLDFINTCIAYIKKLLRRLWSYYFQPWWLTLTVVRPPIHNINY
jgi:hypothetical protein